MTEQKTTADDEIEKFRHMSDGELNWIRSEHMSGATWHRASVELQRRSDQKVDAAALVAAKNLKLTARAVLWAVVAAIGSVVSAAAAIWVIFK